MSTRYEIGGAINAYLAAELHAFSIICIDVSPLYNRAAAGGKRLGATGGCGPG